MQWDNIDIDELAVYVSDNVDPDVLHRIITKPPEIKHITPFTGSVLRWVDTYISKALPRRPRGETKPIILGRLLWNTVPKPEEYKSDPVGIAWLEPFNITTEYDGKKRIIYDVDIEANFMLMESCYYYYFTAKAISEWE